MRYSVTTLLLMLAFTANASEEVARLSGSGNSTTQAFDVEAPWILDWRVMSEFPQSMAIEISLVDADTGFHDGLVLQTKHRGNGVKLFRHSGRYRLRISATLAEWNVKIIELSEQEAKEYTPRGET